MNAQAATVYATPRELRAAIRAGQFTGPTAGQSPGFAQANLVIVPAEAAEEFAEFCRLNAQACPLIARTLPGNPEPTDAAPGADLRSDVPRYRVFRHGVAEAIEPTDIQRLWRDDLVGFLLGCSFTFEAALEAAGLPVRHVVAGSNVPMFRTRLAMPTGRTILRPAGREHASLPAGPGPARVREVTAPLSADARSPDSDRRPSRAGDC